MPVISRKINVDAIRIGMYVSAIDRPWSETPFPLQGFHIQTETELKELQRLCNWVKIDLHRSRKLDLATLSKSSNPTDPCAQYGDNTPKPSREIINLKIRAIQNPTPYQTRYQLARELRTAKKLQKRFNDRFTKVLNNIRPNGRMQLEHLRVISSDLVESILRNPDAFTYLNRMEKFNHSIFSFSIRIATWAVLMGRHLHISKDVLNDLAVASLLCKVGYLSLSSILFEEKGTPSPQVEEVLKASLLKGVKQLQDAKTFSSRIIKTVSYHLERFDGSGYPRGVAGRHIPFLAQIVGLCDYYETITSYDFRDDPYGSTDAIRELYRLRNKGFDPHLVEEFIQAIGLYPTGSVVKLSNQQIAIVSEQNPKARLKPKVTLVLANRRWRSMLGVGEKKLDLTKQPDDLRITASLPPLPDFDDKKQTDFFNHAIAS